MLQSLAILPFLTPGIFAAGAAATSIPIIIHLLNRRRFRTIIWAAMDFLLAAQRRNARRLRFQRWLLLILRILAIIVIAAAIAQLTLNNTAAAIFGGSDRGIIIIWDDSYPMGHHADQSPSDFEKSRKLLADWITHISASDRVALLRGSGGAEPLIATPTPDHASVSRAIANTQLSDAGTDLAGALDRAAALAQGLESTTRQRQVILITNCTKGSIGSHGGKSETETTESLKKAVEKVKQYAALRVIDMGQAKQFNLGITNLETAKADIVAGYGADYLVSVYNAFDAPQLDVPLSLTVDGVVVASEKISRIEPGSTRDVLISYNIPTPGRHLVEAKLTTPLDTLEIDDSRRLIANVVRELPVLIVDGSPADQLQVGASYFLEHDLSPGGNGKNPSVFATHVITELEFPRTPLAEFAAVVLTNTSAPDAATLASLKKYVADGGLLIFFPGNRTNAEAINRSLGDGGARLLPATLGPQIKVESTDATGADLHLDPLNYIHPMLKAFGDAAHNNNINTGLTSVQFSQYIRLTMPANSGAETVMNFSNGSPAVVLGRTGRGKVVVFASSSDTTWNIWGPLPSYPQFMQELLHYGISHQADTFTRQVGQRIHLLADVAAPGNWIAPHNTTITVLTTIDKDKDEGRSFLSSEPLRLAGVYAPPTSGAAPVIAANTDPDVVDIRHVPAAQMAATLGVDATDLVSQPNTLELPTTSIGKNANSDVGRNLIPIALALLLAETLLARLFSVYR